MARAGWQRRQSYMQGDLGLNPHYRRALGRIVQLLGGSCECGAVTDKEQLRFCPLDEGLPDLKRLIMSFQGRTQAWKTFRRYHLACAACYHDRGHAILNERLLPTSGVEVARILSGLPITTTTSSTTSTSILSSPYHTL